MRFPFVRALVGLATGVVLTGCYSGPGGVTLGERNDDAYACLAEVMPTYEGKTYTELHQRIDGRQDSRRIRKRGHTYEVLVTVSPDVEHQPDGIQVDFDVFDGDKTPTMTPVKDTVYLRAGGVFHVPKK